MGTSYAAAGRTVAHNMVTTQFELDGFRVVRTLARTPPLSASTRPQIRRRC